MSLLFNVIKRMILRKKYPEDIEQKIYLLFINNKINEDEYNALINLLNPVQ